MSRIDLSWSAPASGNAATYNVYRRVAPNAWPSNPTPINPSALTTTTFSDTNVSASNTYVYFVRAYSSSGVASPDSDKTFVFTGTSSAPSVPAAPTLDFTTASSIRFSWAASTPAAGDVINGYIIERDSDTNYGLNPGDDLSFRDDFPGTGSHTYRVRAHAASGLESAHSAAGGPWSTAADTTVPSTPAAPAGNPDMVTVDSATQITFDWEASTDNESGMKDYELQRAPALIGTWANPATGGPGTTLLVTHPTTIYIDTNVSSPNVYYYRVRARDNALNPSGWATSGPADTSGAASGGRLFQVPGTPTMCEELGPTGRGAGFYLDDAPFSIDLTGATEMTQKFRRWVNKCVPNGQTWGAHSKINFPAGSLMWNEGLFWLFERDHIHVKGNGLKLFVRTSGAWIDWFPEFKGIGSNGKPFGDIFVTYVYHNPDGSTTYDTAPRARKTVVISNCVDVHAYDVEVLSYHFRGNPGYVPYNDPYTGAPLRPLLLTTINAGATTVDIDRNILGLPTRPDGSDNQDWSTHEGLGVTPKKGYTGYYLWIGAPYGLTPDYEILRVTGDVAHPDGNPAHRRLTVVRGQAQPHGSAPKQWTAGRELGPGKIGAEGNEWASGSGIDFEFQHAFSITNGDEFNSAYKGINNRLQNCIARHPYGSNFELGTLPREVQIIDCLADSGGRQGLTPNSCIPLHISTSNGNPAQSPSGVGLDANYNLVSGGLSYGLLCVNLTIQYIGGGWSPIDIEPAANTTKTRDCIIRGTDAANPMSIRKANGFLGNKGRGRGNNDGGIAPDGRYYIDNIVFQDIDVERFASVVGTPGGPYPDGARGKHVFRRIRGHWTYSSPFELIFVFRYKDIEITGCSQPITVNAVNDGGGIFLGAHCSVRNGSNVLVDPMTDTGGGTGTPNLACRSDNGGNIGKNAPNPTLDGNGWPVNRQNSWPANIVLPDWFGDYI